MASHIAESVVKATFADFKLVKGRKQAQLVCEVPIEQANAALAALGGVPFFGSEQWVAIALLTKDASEAYRDAAQPVKPHTPRKWDKIPPAEQAGIACTNQEFATWAEQREAYDPNYGDIATWVRWRCGVNSRAELNTNTVAANKWRALYMKFMARHMTKER